MQHHDVASANVREPAGPPAPATSAAASTGDGAEAATRTRKRTRITLSCKRCRVRKTRCDGVKPCRNCTESGATCEVPDHDGRSTRKKAAILRGQTNEPMTISVRDQSVAASSSQDSTTGQLELSYPGMSDLFPENTHDQSTPTLSAAGNDEPSIMNLLVEASELSGTQDHEQQQQQLPHQQPGLHADGQPSFSLFVMPTSCSSSAFPEGDRIQQASSNQDTADNGLHGEAPLRLQYFRPFGATAIQPGIEEISIALREPPSFSRAPSPTADISTASSAATALPGSQQSGFATHQQFHGSESGPSQTFSQTFFSAPSDSNIFSATVVNTSFESNLFDGLSLFPKAVVLSELLPLFYQKLGGLFPFLTPATVPEPASSGMDRTSGSTSQIADSFLVNCMCALSARFSTSAQVKRPEATRSPATYGIPFADRAKQLLVPLLAYPSPITATGLLLLAYHEFGLNSEGALWMYSGMALRMTMDLGLHLDVPELEQDPNRAAFGKLLWWSCFLLDRTLAFGTGRPLTAKDSDITRSLPSDSDLDLFAAPETDKHAARAFAATVKLFKLYGYIAEAVNVPTAIQASSSEPPSRADPDSTARRADIDDTFVEVEENIADVYANLPDSLQFSPTNLRERAKTGDSLAFLHLHLWYHCIVILLHRPPLLYSKSSAASIPLTERLSIVNNACLAISHIISTADLIDHHTYTASPFVNQCLFVAGKSWIQEYRVRSSKSTAASRSPFSRLGRTSSSILSETAMQNLKICRQALAAQAVYWSGVGWVAAVLDRHAETKGKTSLLAATEGVETFVSRQEMAIFKRLLSRSKSTMTDTSPTDDALLDSFLSAFIRQPNEGWNIGQDDWSFAYSLAGNFPNL